MDWATHAAAVYACRHWHYSGCMPAGKTVKVGAWELGRFIGCVIFGRGANNNSTPTRTLHPSQFAALPVEARVGSVLR
jgi:hypothetical protein